MPPLPAGRITLHDLKKCKLASVFFDTFFNIEKYLDHEQREQVSVFRVSGGSGARGAGAPPGPLPSPAGDMTCMLPAGERVSLFRGGGGARGHLRVLSPSPRPPPPARVT